jgi:hypothetical protein
VYAAHENADRQAAKENRLPITPRSSQTLTHHAPILADVTTTLLLEQRGNERLPGS